VLARSGNDSIDVDDDDGDDDDDDGDDDDHLVVAGMSSGLRVQVEKRQADGRVRGQEGDERDVGSGHRPGHASVGHIGQRSVGGRAAA